MTDPLRHVAETAGGAVAASSWLWLHHLNEIVAAIAGIAGAILVILKVIQIWREMRYQGYERTQRHRRRDLSGAFVFLILLAGAAV